MRERVERMCQDGKDYAEVGWIPVEEHLVVYRVSVLSNSFCWRIDNGLMGALQLVLLVNASTRAPCTWGGDD